MIILLLNIIFLTSAVANLNKVNKVIKFDRYEICDTGPKNPFILENFVLNTVNHGTLVNTSLEILHDVEHIEGTVNLYRCSSRETLDSCIFFTKLVAKDTCLLFKQKGTIISPMIYSYKPPFKCPFRKGRYTLINGSFDPSLTGFIPLERWYWKFEFKLYNSDTKDYYVTFCVAGQIIVNVQ